MHCASLVNVCPSHLSEHDVDELPGSPLTIPSLGDPISRSTPIEVSALDIYTVSPPAGSRPTVTFISSNNVNNTGDGPFCKDALDCSLVNVITYPKDKASRSDNMMPRMTSSKPKPKTAKRKTWRRFLCGCHAAEE